MNNLFGNSVYSSQITRTIENGSHALLGSDKFLNYDRTGGDVILNLPKLSNFLEDNSKSGNTISLNYILSDLTSGSSLNSFKIVCDVSDNINNMTSFITNSNGRYTLQATPAGWLLVSLATTESKGVFNTSSMSFSTDLTTQDFSQYYGVAVENTNQIGVNYNLSYSNILEYFAIRLNLDCVSLSYSNNSILKKVDWANSSMLVNAVIDSNPILEYIHISRSGLGVGVLANVTLSNCPLLTNVDFSKNALTVASVDGVLAYLDSTGVTGGTVILDLGTNAPPTGGAGNPNVLSLQGKGWTVTTN